MAYVRIATGSNAERTIKSISDKYCVVFDLQISGSGSFNEMTPVIHKGESDCRGEVHGLSTL